MTTTISTISCWSCGLTWHVPTTGVWRFTITYRPPSGPCIGHRWECVAA